MRGWCRRRWGRARRAIGIAFTNAGTVVAQTGTINFSNGGTLESNFTALAGATIQFTGGAFSWRTTPVLTGPRAIRFTGGTLTLLNDLIPGLQMTGGTLSFEPCLSRWSDHNII